MSEILYFYQTTFDQLNKFGQTAIVACDHPNCDSLYDPMDIIRHPQKAIEILNNNRINFAKTKPNESGESIVSVNSNNFFDAIDCVERSRCRNCRLANQNE